MVRRADEREEVVAVGVEQAHRGVRRVDDDAGGRGQRGLRSGDVDLLAEQDDPERPGQRGRLERRREIAVQPGVDIGHEVGAGGAAAENDDARLGIHPLDEGDVGLRDPILLGPDQNHQLRLLEGAGGAGACVGVREASDDFAAGRSQGARKRPAPDQRTARQTECRFHHRHRLLPSRQPSDVFYSCQ